MAQPTQPNFQRAILLGLTVGCVVACLVLAISAAFKVDRVDCAMLPPSECSFEKDIARNVAQKQWVFVASLGAFGMAGLLFTRSAMKKKEAS